MNGAINRLNVFELFSTTEQPIIDKINKGIEIANKLFNNISKSIKSFPVDGFFEVICSFLLVENHYPPCLYLSKEQQLSVIEFLSNQNSHSVEQIIFSAYNEQIIQEMCNNWCQKISEKRRPILLEAIDCYINGKYYSCNALLLSQYGGIIRDNNAYFMDSSADDFLERLEKLKEEQEELIKEKQKTDKAILDKDINRIINSEKNIAQRHARINLQGSLYAFEQYFTKYVYQGGNISKTILNNVANRNKVLHGDDCTFGTKIKALKTIICMDMLINLPEIQTKIWEDKHNG